MHGVRRLCPVGAAWLAWDHDGEPHRNTCDRRVCVCVHRTQYVLPQHQEWDRGMLHGRSPKWQ